MFFFASWTLQVQYTYCLYVLILSVSRLPGTGRYEVDRQIVTKLLTVLSLLAYFLSLFLGLIGHVLIFFFPFLVVLPHHGIPVLGGSTSGNTHSKNNVLRIRDPT
jgi:hypothetical protein